MAMPRIWVVCPCFFDVPSFRRVREDTLAAVSTTMPEADVVFVLADDSGRTDPEARALESGPSLRVVSLPYNMGHQGALVYALRMLGGQVHDADYIVTMDSDGEDRPTDIPAMLKPLVEQEDQLSLVALAWRTARQESLTFRAGYTLYRFVFYLLTGKVMKNGNLAAYRGWFLKEVIYHPHFDQCYSSSFISLPLRIHFVPLPRGIRYFGQSRMGYFGLITHGLKMLMPFTERIATRGVIVSGVLAVCSVVLLLAMAALSPLLAILAFLCFFAFTLVTGLFVLLFATFSQSKALSLRRLRELDS